MNYNSRFLVFTLVQDWIFETNAALQQQQLREFDHRLALEAVIAEQHDDLRLAQRRVDALEAALRFAEDANMQLAAQNALYVRHVGRCLECNEPLHAHFPRRVRRRLHFENPDVEVSTGSEGDTTDQEELPSDVDDVEL